MTGVRSRTLGALLDELAERAPDAPAVVHAQGTTTYSELNSSALLLAAALADLGVRPGERVCLLAGNQIEWLETYFATAAVGGITHAFNTWVTGPELEFLMDEAQCAVLVMRAELGKHRYLDELRKLVPELWASGPGKWVSERYPNLRAVVVIAGDAPHGCYRYDELLTAVTRSDHTVRAAIGSAVGIGVVLYTSGSTARPKAVPLLQYGMIENGFHIGERMGLSAADRVWLGSPLFWSYGCANALMATFTHGAALILQAQFDASEALDLIEGQRCTALYLLPTLSAALRGAPGFDRHRLGSVRTGLTIGSQADLELAAEGLGIGSICNVYGLTEVYGNCCVTPHDAPLSERLVGQGPPLPGVQVRIVDPSTGALRAAGEVGEIQVGGPYVMPGYLGAHGPSNAFTEDGYFRTGDLGSVDEKGWMHYSTRSSDMIKTAGINVAPAEVEEVLLALDPVSEAAVVGMPDPVRGEIVTAIVVARDGVDLPPEELISACRGVLASYKIPSRIVFVDALPKTATGKLHRAGLRMIAENSRSRLEAPDSRSEQP